MNEVEQNYLAQIDWTAVGSIATCIQTIIVVIALLYAVKQLKEANKSRAISIFLPLYEQINSPESVTLRKRIYNDLPSDIKLYNDEHNKLVNTVVNQFDFLGYLSICHLTEKEVILPLYYGTIIRCWEASSSYIINQRELRKTNFAEYFERLYDDCVNYVLDKQINLATYKDVAKNNSKKSRNNRK